MKEVSFDQLVAGKNSYSTKYFPKFCRPTPDDFVLTLIAMTSSMGFAG
jgi:hypothetical protein